MRDYDLTGLSTRSFERLVQALALKEIGSGVVIYGDGPDGGREATFNGKLSLAGTRQDWDGYVVIQAKFRQRPEGTKADGDWALAQLKTDLQTFVDDRSGRRKPEYYVFATNVVMSAVHKKGAKDKAAAAFATFQKKLKMRDWQIWDFDQLRTLIDAHEDVRRAYAAFITPGDVLAEVMKGLETRRPDFDEVMTLYLSRELRGAQMANLERKGEHQIELSRVFVDLPSSTERVSEPPQEKDTQITGFLQALLEFSKEKFNVDSQMVTGRPMQFLAMSEPGRYVIVGGPGQGKTTLAQFACQLFRAAILRGRQRKLERETRDALAKLSESCAAAKIELPAARRFPIFVTLSEFAAALARSSDQPSSSRVTLLSYIVDRIARRTDHEVEIDDFRRWLAVYPWLLVLDGLDEVPSSSNRNDVMRAINDFWDEVAQVEADVLFLGTTRPQDYKSDFQHAEHHYLVPLSAGRALAYAHRLIDEKHTDADRREVLMHRLEEASRNDATLRLMRSPLQVTIMATLVDTIGRAPQDKWRLFNEYFGAIYRRELERDTHRALLSQYRTDIEIIHYRVGLELQVASEKAGGTEARLTRTQFEEIVRHRLISRNHQGELFYRLTQEIVGAATARLVFIVEPMDGLFGFEIRSLQEFMAAEALMNGDTTDVRNRLRAIAPIASWRNVFVFAAGRCFARDEVLIDSITSICSDLNLSLGGEQGKAIKAGSLLALDLLEDGSAAAIPSVTQILTKIALELLSLPSSDVHRRLADIYSPAFDELFRDAVDEVLARAATNRNALWKFLFRMIQNGVQWAQGVADSFLPKHPSERFGILSYQAAKDNAWRCRQLNDISHLVSPAQAIAISYENIQMPIYVRALRVNTNVKVLIPRPRLSLVSVSNVSDNGYSEFAALPEPHHPDWSPLKFLACIKKLDAQNLCHIVDVLPDADHVWIYRLVAPWPVIAAAAELVAGAEREPLKRRLQSGELGNYQDWIAAEKRWAHEGVTMPDLDKATPWGVEIAKSGFPACLLEFSGLYSRADFRDAYEMYRQLGPQARPYLGDAMLTASIAEKQQMLENPDPEDIGRMVDETSRAHLHFGTMSLFDLTSEDPRWVEVADRLGYRVESIIGEGSAEVLSWLVSKCRQNPSRIGLLRFLMLIVGRHDIPVSELPVIDPAEVEPAHRWAPIARLVAEGIDSHENARTFALMLADIPAKVKSVTLWRLSSIATRSKCFTEGNDEFFLEMDRDLTREDMDARRWTIEYLTESFRRRRSGLADVPTWRELKLPEMPGH